MHCCSHLLPDTHPRRRALLRWVAVAPALSFAVLPRAMAGSTTEALLLSCMDFRLMDDIERYMGARGLRDKYDHVILAGASLGAITERFPAWNKTFWDHLGLAIQLHSIERVVVIDHRDCGAYKMLVGPEHASTRGAETQAHARHLRQLKSDIAQRHPKLMVETLLMALDGSVEAV